MKTRASFSPAVKLSALAVLSAAMWTARPALAGNGGGEPFDFLFLDGNARSVGMGGAYGALADDSNALLYNPGGLGMIKRYEATFMHNRHVEGVSHEYIALAGPLMEHGLGVMFDYVKFGDLRRTTYAQPDGKAGNVGVNDLAISAGYGHTFPGMDNLSLGGALKYLREGIDDTSMSGMAFDVGGMWSDEVGPGRLNLGLSVQNVGPDVKFQKQTGSGPREKLPANVRGAGAFSFNLFDMKHTVAVDISKERSQDTVGGVGFETVVAKVLGLRFGFNSRNSSGVGLSGGVGWINPDFGIDYAVVPYGDLGVSHRFSVTARWGGEPQKTASKNLKPASQAGK